MTIYQTYDYLTVRLHRDQDGVLLGDFQFVNESGHKLDPIKDVLVTYTTNGSDVIDAGLAKSDEISGQPPAMIALAAKYDGNHPGYDVRNVADLCREIAAILVEQPRNGPLKAVIHDPKVAALDGFVRTIEATGGVVRLPSGHHVPRIDPDWVDLGEAYLMACAAIGRQPMVKHSEAE